MTLWIKELKFGKVLLTSVIFTVISFIIRQVEAILTMKYYLMPQYFGVWSKTMMPSNGPPPPSFMVTSLIFTLVSGISVTFIYYYLKDHLPTPKVKRITYFADLLMGTYLVFFTLPVYLMFNVPVGLLISWFISTFIIVLLGAWVMVSIIK